MSIHVGQRIGHHGPCTPVGRQCHRRGSAIGLVLGPHPLITRDPLVTSTRLPRRIGMLESIKGDGIKTDSWPCPRGSGINAAPEAPLRLRQSRVPVADAQRLGFGGIRIRASRRAGPQPKWWKHSTRRRADRREYSGGCCRKSMPPSARRRAIRGFRHSSMPRHRQQQRAAELEHAREFAQRREIRNVFEYVRLGSRPARRRRRNAAWSRRHATQVPCALAPQRDRGSRFVRGRLEFIPDRRENRRRAMNSGLACSVRWMRGCGFDASSRNIALVAALARIAALVVQPMDFAQRSRRLTRSVQATSEAGYADPHRTRQVAAVWPRPARALPPDARHAASSRLGSTDSGMRGSIDRGISFSSASRLLRALVGERVRGATTR